MKQGVENEIVLLKQTKSEREKELAAVQEELQQKKQIAGNTEVLLTADKLQQYVKTNTAPYKYPRVIEYVENLPKTFNGKIRRSEIRDNDMSKHKAE